MFLMHLIVGLGNPGKEYEDTRHNVGFLVVDKLMQRLGVSPSKKFNGEIAEGRLHDEKILLLKPLTFMNASGQSVREVIQYYKILLTDVTVVHDDLDLPFGSVLIKEGQGSAGHNGVQSIIDAFGGEKGFTRVRIGIGRPVKEGGAGEVAVENWVLGKWSTEEKKNLDAVIDGVVAEIEK